MGKQLKTNSVNYEDDDYHHQRHAELINDEKLLIAWSKFAHRYYFDSLCQPQSILEFGGGLGNNLIEVVKFAEVDMIEPAPIGRKSASKFGIASFASLDEIPLNKQYDYILCRHVLEHLISPYETLVNLRGRLKVGGRLVLIVPYEKPFWDTVPEDLNHHLYCWNFRNLKNLLAESGFKVTGSRYVYFAARRKLSPLAQIAGWKLYTQAVFWLGFVLQRKEILVETTVV